MEKITSFTQLRTWQNARTFAVSIYRITERLPVSERFGLTSQMRRSSVSIAANIAEGFSRGSASDKARFYMIALGSLTETLSHTYIASDLGFVRQTEVQYIEQEVTELHKMLNGLIKSARGKVA